MCYNKKLHKEGDKMNIKKQTEQILNRVNKNKESSIIPITLDGITELTYKHDPHTSEQSKLNLVIEEYLIDEADRIPINVPIVIELRFNQKKENDTEIAGQIIANNFRRLVDNELLRKKREIKRWRFNLIIGISFLVICMALSQLFSKFVDGAWASVLKETFSIIGWVALWEPASYFLYGWREDRERITTAIRLQFASVRSC